MSYGYTKLFGSILDSTIWLEDLHVKVVWITMLAMSDRDGIVEGSIPGLAKRAGVAVPQCEESLDKFLAPDKYSRSQDFDGRRIEVVDGGWRLLNREKYRDKLDAEDQREKAAERQRRKRDRERDMSRESVTERDSHAKSRQTETETETESRELSPPDLPVRRELPDPDPRPIARADLGAPPPQAHTPLQATNGHVPALSPPPGIPMPGARDRRTKLNHDAWQYAALKHAELRSEGISPDAVAWPPMPAGAPQSELVARTREVVEQTGEPPDFDAARATVTRRIDVAVAEARRKDVQHLRWFTPSLIWDAKNFWRALEFTPAEAAKPRAGPAPRGTPAAPTEPPRRLRNLNES